MHVDCVRMKSRRRLVPWGIVTAVTFCLLFAEPAANAVQGGAQKSPSETGPEDGGPRGLFTPAGAHAVRQAGPEGRAYAATRGGLYASDDGGAHWAAVSIGPRQEEVFSIATARQQPGLVIVGRRDGLWKSSNGGADWSAVKAPVVGPYAPVALTMAESDPNLLYLATARNGVFRSPDGGRTWKDITGGLSRAATSTEPEEYRSLAVNPAKPEVVYLAGDRGSLYRTFDSGEHWEPVPRPAAALRPASVASIPRIAFSPDGADRIYVVLGLRVHSQLVRNRLFTVGPEGEWRAVAASLPDNVTVVDIAVEPGRNRLTVWSDQGRWEVSLTPPSKNGAEAGNEPK